MMKILSSYFISPVGLFLLALAVPGLSAKGETSDTGVQRVAADEAYDLSGKWNDVDSQKVAGGMVDKILSANWLKDWEKKPIVIVGDVRNNTSEHIDTRLFVKDLEAELINSGEIAFVANSTERAQVRGEREEQQSHASEETMKRIAQEAGADYMLIGGVDSSVEETPQTKVVYYLVSMELIDVESNIKVWIGTDRIKKVINKSTRSRRDTIDRVNSDW
ncbi:MAG: penicillin-binding protein activator LpoB [Spirochaetota bacterium]